MCAKVFKLFRSARNVVVLQFGARVKNQDGREVMALFPFFMNIRGKTGLIIGGGKHALEKIERLCPYEPKLLVLAETFLPEMEELFTVKPDGEATESSLLHTVSVQFIKHSFTESDLDLLPTFVIAATDSREENRRIAALCKMRRILVNAVDDAEMSDFIFPSLVAKGKLSIGICTEGASPSVGIQLKKKIETMLPDRVEEILDWLQEKRPVLMREIPDGKKRFAFYHKLSEQCMCENRPLSETEFLEMLEKQKNV